MTRDPTKAESYGVPSWRDVETALSVLDADAVYIATLVFLHAPQTITALRAGRHVLCEKADGVGLCCRALRYDWNRC